MRACAPKLIAIMFVTWILFFGACRIPSTVYAVVTCAQQPDYWGPQFALPLTSKPSCDTYDGDSPLFTNLITNGEIRGVTNAQLVGKYIGNDSLKSQLNGVTGTGNASVDLDKNTNLAIDSEVLDKTTADGIPVNQEIFTLKKVVSMSDNLSPVGINAECFGLGITDRVACAEKYGATLEYPSTGIKRVNSLKAYTSFQNLSTLRTQLGAAMGRASESMHCEEDGAANIVHCGNQYGLSKAGGNSIDLANQNMQILTHLNFSESLNNYFNLPALQRQQLLAQDNKKAQTTLLVVQKIPTNLISSVFNVAFGLNKPYIIRGTNPGLPNIIDGLAIDFKRWNPLKTGQAELLKIKPYVDVSGPHPGTTATATIPRDGTAGLSQAAINKVLDRIQNADCGPNLTYTQLMGAVSTSKSTGGASIHWSFSFSDIAQAIGDAFPMNVYKACAIDPPEYGQIAQFTSRSPLSPTRSYYTLATTAKTKPSDIVDIYQEILSVPPTAGNQKSATVPGKTHVVPCTHNEPVGTVCTAPDTEKIATEYTTNAGLQHQGGEFAEFFAKQTRQQAFQTLTSPERFTQCSYAKDVQIRQPVKFAYLNTDSLRQGPLQCPQDPNSTPTNPGGWSIDPEDISAFLKAGAQYFIAWQYSGDKQGNVLDSDQYSFYKGGPTCAILQAKATEFPGQIGVNMGSIANKPEDQIQEHLTYVKNSCGTSIVRFWGWDDPAKITKVLSVGKSIGGLKFIVSLANTQIDLNWFASGYQSNFKPHAQEVAAAISNAGLGDVVYALELVNEPHCGGDTNCLGPYNTWASTMGSLLPGFTVGIGQMASQDSTRGDSPGQPAVGVTSDFYQSNKAGSINTTSGHYYNDTEKANVTVAMGEAKSLNKPFYIGEAPFPDTGGNGNGSDDGGTADICAIAAENKVSCKILDAVWHIETNAATSCADSSGDGPMAITAGAETEVNADHALNKCNLADAFTLGARVLKWKKCGPGNWNRTDCEVLESTDPASRDLQTVGQYNGSNNCSPNLVTQCRWGQGKSYCDAAIAFMTGQNPNSMWPCSPAMCQEWSCSPGGPSSVACGGQQISCTTAL